MADSTDVYGALVNTGNTLKADLWQPDDLKTLQMIAIDLVGLNAKVLICTNPEDKQRYAEAVMRLMDHSALLALSRLNVATNDIWTALKNFFLKLIGQWQPQLLPALNNMLPGINTPATGTGTTGTGSGTSKSGTGSGTGTSGTGTSSGSGGGTVGPPPSV